MGIQKTPPITAAYDTTGNNPVKDQLASEDEGKIAVYIIGLRRKKSPIADQEAARYYKELYKLEPTPAELRWFIGVLSDRARNYKDRLDFGTSD